MTVAQRWPESRDTVEKRAAAKAIPSPNSASRNLAQTSAEADCSHGTARAANGVRERSGLATVELTQIEPSTLSKNGQSPTPCKESVRNQSGLPRLDATAASGSDHTVRFTTSDSRLPVLRFSARTSFLPQNIISPLRR